MTTAPFGRVDPTDLGSLRHALASRDGNRQLAPIGLQAIDIGTDALERVAERVTAIRRSGPIVLLEDRTRMRWLWEQQLQKAMTAFFDLRCAELWS